MFPAPPPQRLSQVLFVDAPWVFKPGWEIVRPVRKLTTPARRLRAPSLWAALPCRLLCTAAPLVWSPAVAAQPSQRAGAPALHPGPFSFSFPARPAVQWLKKYAALVRFVSVDEVRREYFTAESVPQEFAAPSFPPRPAAK